MADWLTRHPVLGAAGAGLAFVLCWAFTLRLGFAISGVLTGAACAVLIARHLPRIRAVFTWLGRRSLEIFILHFAFIDMLAPLLRGWPRSGWWAVPVLTAAVGLSLLARRILEPVAP